MFANGEGGRTNAAGSVVPVVQAGRANLAGEGGDVSEPRTEHQRRRDEEGRCVPVEAPHRAAEQALEERVEVIADADPERKAVRIGVRGACEAMEGSLGEVEYELT